jgi:formylglycine-generating enzyme required for sulfatase activity
MLNMRLRTLLCLSLLFPATCQTRAGAIAPAGASRDRAPDAGGDRAFPIPEMVRLQGGTFQTRGDPGRGIGPENYTVGTFWIGKYEVTFEQFDRFCEDTGYYRKRYGGIDRPVPASTRAAIERVANEKEAPDLTGASRAVQGQLQGYPVIAVCWLDAMAYCLWLTEKTGLPFRLPTQIEWEYACTVGGSEPAPGDTEELDKVAWCAVNMQSGVGRTQIHPVGRKQPNGAGIYDMYGNVWEWCLDGREEGGYPRAVQEWDRVRRQLSPMDMDKGSQFLESASSLFRGPKGNAKALRGGAWGEPSFRVSPSFRMFYPQNYIAERVGFRVLCSGNPGGVFPSPPAASSDRAGPIQKKTGESPSDRTRSLERRIAELQAKIDELMPRYQAMLADDFSAYPVLAWRDELQAIQERYQDMLPSRERTNKIRDSLPSTQRQEYSRLRALYAWRHFASYAKSEPEYLLVFLTEPNSRLPLAAKAREEQLARIASKETAADTEFAELRRSTSLPPELIERAKVDGEMEGRVNVLEAALRKIESHEASAVGHQIQMLRYQLKHLDNPEALGRAALEEVTNQLLDEQDIDD